MSSNRPTLIRMNIIPGHCHCHKSQENYRKSLSYSRRRLRTYRRSVPGSTVFEEEDSRRLATEGQTARATQLKRPTTPHQALSINRFGEFSQGHPIATLHEEERSEIPNVAVLRGGSSMSSPSLSERDGVHRQIRMSHIAIEGCHEIHVGTDVFL
jgi:hypothetical protein